MTDSRQQKLGAAFLQGLAGWVCRSRLELVVEVAQMFERHLDKLLPHLNRHIPMPNTQFALAGGNENFERC
jgi:hypothetical protein